MDGYIIPATVLQRKREERARKTDRPALRLVMLNGQVADRQVVECCLSEFLAALERRELREREAGQFDEAHETMMARPRILSAFGVF